MPNTDLVNAIVSSLQNLTDDDMLWVMRGVNTLTLEKIRMAVDYEVETRGDEPEDEDAEA